MSAESIARWNAIPMTRQENDGLSTPFTGMKRYRDDDEVEEHDGDIKLDGDGSDDDVSLVSRSPSPVPHDQMDIDKYDDYVRGHIREVITVDTKIKSTNKGFKMLSKLGWVEGQPLGLSQDARIDPIPFHVKNDGTGLGKTSQDFRMIETTVSQRRELDSERQRNETEEQRKAREGNVARRVALQTEISEVLRPFYCTVCEKQFQNVAQYDEHTNSYAHHHKIRFRDMQNTQRVKQNTPEEQDRRKEKERKREEKELRKIAAAAGVSMTKSTTSAQLLAPVPTAGESKPAAFKKGGWANISTGTANSSSSPSEAPPTTRAGWGVVGSSANTSSSLVSDTTSSGRFLTAPETSQPRDQFGQHQPQDVQERPFYQPAPAFRTGGWSTIDSTTRIPPPSSLSRDVPTSSSAMAVDVHHDRPSEEQLPDPGSTPTTLSAHLLPETVSQPLSALPSLRAPIVNTESVAPKPLKSKKVRETEMRESARSGWQSFQRGGRRK